MAGRIADGPRLTRARRTARDAQPPAEDVVFGPVADDDVEAVVALWRACDLTRPWNDPYRDVADARLGETSTVLVGRATRDLPEAASGDGGAVRAGEVVATAMAGVVGHRGWLYYVAVDPRLQGSGTGRATPPPRRAHGRCASWCARPTTPSAASTSASATPTRSASCSADRSARRTRATPGDDARPRLGS